MTSHSPIPIITTHTDDQGKVITTHYGSLCKASKAFSISTHTLQLMALGKTPTLPAHVPSDLKVTQVITETPVQREKPLPPNEQWHCNLCNKDMKYKSKSTHLSTIGHRKKEDAAKQLVSSS
jgi:hypothetical protein